MIQLMMSHMVQSWVGCRRATTMRGAGDASRKLSICLILLFGCPGLQAVSTSSNMSLQATLLLDLNRTVFIDTIVLNTTSGNHGGVTVNTQDLCKAKVNLTNQSVTGSQQNDIDGFCCSPSTPPLQETTVLDLNTTFFIDSIVLNATFGNHDCIDVDIGTESCGSFDDRACYVTCSSRDIVQITGCSVTINVTCDVDNVKGRYVRVRQNSAAALELCDLKVIRYPDLGKDSRNFALNAPCTQSTTYGDWQPGRAVDGNRNGQNRLSCSHTRFTSSSHWWRVDLRKLILVSLIIIANRQDCCSERLANFTVELGRLESNGSITYTLCRYHDGVAGPLTTLNCTRSIWGQFVRISLTGSVLTLCEVEVYGDTDANNTELLSGATDELTTLLEVRRESTMFVRDTGGTTMSTGLTRDTDETTMSTGLTRDTDETTMSTGLTRDTDGTTMSTGLTRDTDGTTMSTGLTRDTDGTTMSTGLTRDTDETTVSAGLTRDTDGTTMSIGLTRDTDETTVSAGLTRDTDGTTMSTGLTRDTDETTVSAGLTRDTDETTMSTGLTRDTDETTVSAGLTRDTDGTTMSTGLTRDTDETTVSAGLTRDTDETTMSTGLTRDTDETTVSTGLTRDTDETTMSTGLTRDTDETTVSTGLTRNTDETTMSIGLTRDTDETTMSTGLTTETRATAELTTHPQESIVPTSFTNTKHYYCRCRFEPAKQNKSQQEAEEVVQMTEELKVQHPTLGKQIRKKSSAADLRMSSTVMGIVVTAVFSFIFAVIVLCDLHHFRQHLFHKEKIGRGRGKV